MGGSLVGVENSRFFLTPFSVRIARKWPVTKTESKAVVLLEALAKIEGKIKLGIIVSVSIRFFNFKTGLSFK